MPTLEKVLSGEGALIHELAADVGAVQDEHFRDKFGDAFLIYTGKVNDLKPPKRQWATITGDSRRAGDQSLVFGKSMLVYAIRHTERTLSSSFVSVGRLPQTNDIIINDQSVSALHAVFEKTATGYAIRDMGARNGTYVNGQAVPKNGTVEVRPGDGIRLGSVTLMFFNAEAISTILRQLRSAST